MQASVPESVQKVERDDKKRRKEQEGEARELGLESRTESKTMHASVVCAVEMTEREMSAGRLNRERWRRMRLGYACRLVFVRGRESSSSSLSSPSSERDRFLPRPRQVISGYSHCLQRFAHCLQKRGTDTVSNVLHKF